MSGKIKLMNLKKLILTLAQWVVLSMAMTILWSMAMAFTPLLFNIKTQMSSADTWRTLLAMLIVSLVNTGVIMYLIQCSRWSGVRLLIVISLAIFTVQFFLVEAEILYFQRSVKMQTNLIFSHFVAGLLFAVLFSFIAVLILGKVKKSGIVLETSNKRKSMLANEFLFKFLVLSLIAYPLLYFVFGYFIAWQFPAVREFYSGSTLILPFFKHLRYLLIGNPKLPLWQMMRGALLVVLALPLIRMMKGSAWEAAVVVGLTFALVMNSRSLIPNPYMPARVRLPHFIETASSNFIWGMFIVWLMHRSHKSLADLFKKRARNI